MVLYNRNIKERQVVKLAKLAINKGTMTGKGDYMYTKRLAYHTYILLYIPNENKVMLSVSDRLDKPIIYRKEVNLYVWYL